MRARAICQEPQILILDEPTSYLDVKYKLEFLSILQEMKHQKKLTVIMSLHELDLACLLYTSRYSFLSQCIVLSTRIM